jgi:hypothetical protein
MIAQKPTSTDTNDIVQAKTQYIQALKTTMNE